MKIKEMSRSIRFSSVLLVTVIIVSGIIPIGNPLAAGPPTHTDPLIYSSESTNTTLEDIIVVNQSTSDPDFDQVTNIYNWYRDNVSLTWVNMPFDTNGGSIAKDYSPYSSDGTLYGGTTWVADGIVGGAYSFDGVDDYIEVTDSFSVDGNGSWSEISIEFWIKLGSLQEGKHIVSKNGSYLVGLLPGSDNILYWNLMNKAVKYETPLEPDVWYHVVVNYRSSSGMVIHVNGSAVLSRRVSGGHSGSIRNSNYSLGVGGMPGDSSTYVDGVIDGVKIYSVRLNTIQISQLYLESKDGLSNSSTIMPHQTKIDEEWNATVTPNDGISDGLTLVSDSVHILPGPEFMTFKWQAWTPSTGRGVLVADILGDANEEIIHQGHGYITVLDGETGAELWKVDYTPGYIDGLDWYAQAQMADMDQDGTLEIIVPITGPYDQVGIAVLNSEDGSEVWSVRGPWGELTAAPVVGDINGDGYPTIFVGSSDIYRRPISSYTSQVMAFSHTGELLYSAPVWRLCAGGLSLADTDHDGVFEVYGGDRAMYYGDGGFGRGLVSWWADNLTLRWFDPEILMSSNIPMIVDVDHDGVLDVVGVELRGGIVVLNSTNGQPIRKDLKLNQLGGHYQAAVYDLDQDGNVEVLLSDGDHSSTPDDVTVWDLYEWKEDFRDFVGESFYGPKAGDVDGDGNLDMIVCTDDGIYVYDDEFRLIAAYEGLEGVLNYVTVQDIDGDGLNEVLAPSGAGFVYAFDTVASVPNPRPRTEVQLGSESRQGAYMYIPFTEVEAPTVTVPDPSDGAENVPVDITELSFNVVDYQADPMDYYVSIIPDVISGPSSDTGVGGGSYSVSVSGAQFSTTYTWWVNVTDGAAWSNNSYTFTTMTDGWYSTDWAFKNSITIDYTQVAATLSDFVVLVDISDSDLGDNAQPNGGDILFTSEAGVKLSHEIESYDSGDLVAWVRVPNLSGTSDTVLYMYYGNPTVDNQEAPGAVWDSSYGVVQHLEEGSGDVSDSTSNDNDGAASGGVSYGAVGQVDGAFGFDGSTGSVEIPSSPSISGFSTELTISGWVQLDDLGVRQSIVNKYDTAGNQRGYMLDYDGVSLTFWASPNGVAYSSWSTSYTPPSVAWHHVAVVWESNTVPSFYINGALVSTTGAATIASINDNSGESLFIGMNPYADRYLGGMVDEVRVENAARSAEWIETMYNNVMGSGFVTVGAESVVGDTPIVYGVEPMQDEADVLASIGSLNFTIFDNNGDTMDWYVTTSPDIGSDSGSGTDGTYSVGIAGLAVNSEYTWKVDVTDGGLWTNTSFTFTTESDNYPPTQGTPLLESSFGLNWTAEDITTYNQSTSDPEGDAVTNIYNWERDGEPYAVLNMPFDTDSEGTTKDYSGYGNHGALVGPTWTPNGVVGGAYEFDGVDDFITIPDIFDYLDGDNDRPATTLESWIYMDGFQNDPSLFYKASAYDMRIDYRSSAQDHFLEMVFYQSGGKYTYEVSYPEPLNTSTWYHIVATYQTGEHAQIYINGSAVETAIARDRVYTIITDDNNTLTLRIRARAWTVLVDGVDISDSSEWPDGRRVTGPIVTLTPVPEAWSVSDDAWKVYDDFNAWDFAGWTGNHTGMENPLVLNVNTNMSVMADFVPAGDIHNSGANLDFGRYAYPGTFRYFRGIMDGVRIYPTRLSSEQIMQLYQDSRDGLSNSATIVAEETDVGDVWSAQVTPSDGKLDGTTMTSNLLTIVGETNLPPIVSVPEPGDGATDVPVSTALLNFTLTDLNGDLMNYTVTTTPDIGSNSGISVAGGVYSLAVSGLVQGTEYTWQVNVTDGVEWTNQSLSFITGSDEALAMWMPFDDATTPIPDESGNGNDGTLNGATWESDNGGIYSFDGSGDYINVADDTSLDITDELTVSAWVSKGTMSGAPTYRYIMGKGTKYRNEPYLLMYDHASDKWYFKVYNGASNYVASASASGGWHLVTGVFDGDSVELYVDGVLADSVSFASTSLATNNRALGVGGYASSRYFEGDIDDVRVYSVPLDGAEVGQLYDDTESNYPSTGLSLWMPFDDATTPIPDESGNGNDGTLNGATWLSDNGGIYSFDGSGDYINIADDTSLDITDELTVSAWVSKGTMSGAPSYRYIMGKGTKYRNEPYLLMYDHASDKWYFKVYNGASNYVASASASGGWHLVTGVFDGDSVELYVDGVLADSVSFASTSLAVNNRDLGVGGYASGRYFEGDIDDVRVYSVSLDGAEVGQLYTDTESNYP